ncbi:FAD-dependent oxidoreductase [Geodermatophilus sp. CPCC 205506]|uniref:FAD-dependent oxidoreductase n=1 Tax=Geodermatophilus sp. CPCC 205506 TaxID=2936596 RepID=UPI003EEC0FCE
MTTVSSTGRDGAAVVVGASMAGLLAARVLAERFGRVTVLDSDTLPEDAVPRGGVPQSAHAHGLLAAGLRGLEELFPGLIDELVARGGLVADVQEQFRWVNDGYTIARGRSGMQGILISRPLLEREVRRRTLADPRIELFDRVDVRGLVSDDHGRVRGVAAVDRRDPADRESRRWDADLVVDASGRTSRAPDWLAALGAEPPEEERVEVDVAYSTRWYRREPGQLDGDRGIVIAATPGNPRAGFLLAQEGDRWICALGGYLGDRPPIDPDGFDAYAATLPSPMLHEVIASAEPITEPRRFRFPASVRRRYERLARPPEGLLVTGDAVCSFDPVYGQGMTVACLEALALRDVLRRGVDGPALPRAFWRAIEPVVDVPWEIAVGGDLRIPGVRGPLDRRTRVVNGYIGRVHRAAALDPAVGTAFLRVAHLEAPPASLMAPTVMAHVLVGSRRWPSGTTRLIPVPRSPVDSRSPV